jgi:hypothetical protein
MFGYFAQISANLWTFGPAVPPLTGCLVEAAGFQRV